MQNRIRDLVLVPPELAAKLKVVPVLAQNQIAGNVKEVEAQITAPLVVERLPPLHRLARPEHPQLALRAGPITIRRAHAARLVPRRRARVPGTVRVDEGDVRAALAKVIRGEASPDAGADDDDVR